jgi:hypothetical protein
MGTENLTAETLAALKKAQANPSAELAKANTFVQPGSATSGINFYDLEEGAKLLYPVLTPLRNEIPRVSGRGGIQANWRAITAINVGAQRAGVSEGNRGGMMNVSTQDYVAAYRGIGLESAVTFEADYAAENFDDVKALSVKTLLESLMIQEEISILGGNNSVALGTTGTPALVASASGGTLATLTYSVICVAMTLDNFINSSVAGGIAAQLSRTNTDGSTDVFGGGAAAKSANATVAVTGPTGSIAATVAAKTGAVAYAWFWGAAGSEVLGAITTINSVSITATATGTQTAASLTNGGSDNSTNSLIFDGLLYQAFKSGSNALIVTQPTGVAGTGTPLTGDGAGGIVEFDVVLKSLWDNYRLSPTKIYVSSQEQQNVSKKILAGGSSAAQRFVFTVDQGKIGGGVMVTSYRNKFSMNGAVEIPIVLHPNMPAGTVLFFTNKLPYPLSNVGNVVQVRTRREYYQIEWPLRSRKYEYGVYADEVLQNYFPPSMAVITNIANG